MTGLQPTRVVCRNVTTAQIVQFEASDPSWDCEAAGLVVNAADKVRMLVQGKAR